MRVFYLTASRVPSKAANAVHVMKMSQAFSCAGHEVVLFACHGTEVIAETDYQYYGVSESFEIVKHRWRGIPAVGGLAYGQAVRREVCRRSAPVPDVIYSRHAATAARVLDLGCPVRLEVHSLPENVLQRTALHRVFSSKSFVALITISDALKQAYIGEFPRLAERSIIVAHDGADASPEQKHADVRLEIEGKAPASSAHVGYVGHLYPGKGMELIDQLSRMMPAIAFHVVGGTDADVARWRAATTGRANLFFYGHVPHGKVPSMLSCFDILLAPYQRKVSTYGGKGDIANWMSPLKLFEYMAHGKAMVVSDLPVLREVISDRHNGILCNPDDSSAWAAAIEELIAEPALCRQISQNALRDFRCNYTWAGRAKRVLA